MTAGLRVRKAGPSVTIQDLGRPGHIAVGLSQGGAADCIALIEGAALLRQSPDLAAIEMAGMGGAFEAMEDIRIALTGAPMPASIDAKPLAWNASHAIAAGQVLRIGAARRGCYGYLHLGGGVATDPFMGSRATHLVSGIGAPLAVGDTIPAGADPNAAAAGLILPEADRFSGGTVRILPSVHTALFAEKTRTRFTATQFTRTARGNRQGVELAFDGDGFTAENQLSILSEPMIAGDIQMTGAGMPFVLLPECQTTGGYPRIGTVLPDDLPLVAQAMPGTALRFAFLDYAEALAAHRPLEARYRDLCRAAAPLVRDPRDMADLLGYQLVSGAITGWED